MQSHWGENCQNCRQLYFQQASTATEQADQKVISSTVPGTKRLNSCRMLIIFWIHITILLLSKFVKVFLVVKYVDVEQIFLQMLAIEN